MKDIQDVYEYVTRDIATFEHDPADSEFQEGYLAALEDVLEEGFETEVPVLRTVH